MARNRNNYRQNKQKNSQQPVENEVKETIQTEENVQEIKEVETVENTETIEIENTGVKEETKDAEVKEVITEETKEEVQEPEIKSEVKVEPKAKQNKKPLDEVDAIIADSNLTDREKVEKLKEVSDKSIKVLVKKLLDYNSAMKPPHVPNPKVGASHQYDLLNTIMYSVMKKEKYNDFRKAFNVLNLVFRAYKDEAFKDTRIHRFDYMWKGTEKELKTFNNLVMVITTLLDPATRRKRMKEISLEAALSPEKTNITPEMASNILRYYGVN